MKRRGLDRKGAETSPLSVIIAIIILAVVAITIIYFFTGGFGQLTSKFQLLPSDIEATAQACGGYATGGLAIDYCKFREVKEDTFINCKYIKDKYGEDYEFENINECEGDEVEFCNEEIKENNVGEVSVNGETCETHGATGIVEETQPSPPSRY